MPKPQKPFVAARIPTELEAALAKHIEATRESKTEAIINALSAYVGWTPNSKDTNQQDRLSQIEARLAEIERQLQIPQQTNLLKLSPVISLDNRQDSLDQKEENENTDNTENNVIKLENAPEKLFSHREVSDMTGMKYSTVRGRARGKNPIAEGKNRAFKAAKVNDEWKWKEITNDNAVIQHPDLAESPSEAAAFDEPA